MDLVFYNRLRRCYVLLDLKIGKLAHQDLGQMQMYVNYFDRFVKTCEENSTIGIVLCKQKNKALVEITLPKDADIHAWEYQLYLPSKDELQHKLLEWIEARGVVGRVADQKLSSRGFRNGRSGIKFRGSPARWKGILPDGKGRIDAATDDTALTLATDGLG